MTTHKVNKLSAKAPSASLIEQYLADLRLVCSQNSDDPVADPDIMELKEKFSAVLSEACKALEDYSDPAFFENSRVFGALCSVALRIEGHNKGFVSAQDLATMKRGVKYSLQGYSSMVVGDLLLLDVQDDVASIIARVLSQYAIDVAYQIDLPDNPIWAQTLSDRVSRWYGDYFEAPSRWVDVPSLAPEV